ncbi:hypothetical protein Hte_005947 [Hypoxylon texense]
MADIDCLPKQANILTLNCWGIPYVSLERASRLAEIGQRIIKAEPSPHIVGLQECFSKLDFECIRQATRSALPYAKHYFAAPFGTGLAILSRWPIEETTLFRYSLNGSPTAIYHGDWYVGKGVAYAKVRYGKAPDNVIDVFNTHMHASYPGNEYLCHRLGQAWELGKLLRDALQRRRGRALVVALGDLNTEPSSLPWRIIKHLAPDMNDMWLQSPVRHQPQRPSEAVSVPDGASYGSPYNTWMWTKAQRARHLGNTNISSDQLILPPDAVSLEAMRIDYVLASVAPALVEDTREIDDSTVIFAPGSGNEAESPGAVAHEDGSWAVTAAKVGMVDRHPTLRYSLSDHFSVEVTLAYRRAPVDGKQELLGEPRGSNLNASTEHGDLTHGGSRFIKSRAALAEVVTTSIESLGASSADGLLDEMLHVLSSYRLARQKRAWWRRVRVGASSILVMGSLAGVWLVDRFGWARLLLALAGAFVLSFAVLDACGGMCFDLAEAAALSELEWEINLDRDNING